VICPIDGASSACAPWAQKNGGIWLALRREGRDRTQK
jgi:hypothetical protein